MDNKGQDLVRRMRVRMKAEKIIHQFFEQVYKHMDIGGAREWVENPNFNITLEDFVVYTDKEGFFTVNNEVFKFDFSSYNALCESLLKDR